MGYKLFVQTCYIQVLKWEYKLFVQTCYIQVLKWEYKLFVQTCYIQVLKWEYKLFVQTCYIQVFKWEYKRFVQTCYIQVLENADSMLKLVTSKSRTYYVENYKYKLSTPIISYMYCMYTIYVLVVVVFFLSAETLFEFELQIHVFTVFIYHHAFFCFQPMVEINVSQCKMQTV